MHTNYKDPPLKTGDQLPAIHRAIPAETELKRFVIRPRELFMQHLFQNFTESVIHRKFAHCGYQDARVQTLSTITHVLPL
jgi:hypothetical protein